MSGGDINIMVEVLAEKHERERNELAEKHEREFDALLRNHPDFAAFVNAYITLSKRMAVLNDEIVKQTHQSANVLLSHAKKRWGRGTAEQQRDIKMSALTMLLPYDLPPELTELLAYLIGCREKDRRSRIAWMDAARFAARHPKASVNSIAKILVAQAGGHLDKRRKDVRERRKTRKWQMLTESLRRDLQSHQGGQITAFDTQLLRSQN